MKYAFFKRVVSFTMCSLGTVSFSVSADQAVDYKNIKPSYHQRDFGGVGLLQMPTARMSPEGQFAFFANRVDTYTRAGVSMQPYDWLEGLFRYTDFSNVPYGPRSLSGSQSYKDKSLDLKLRLWDETYYRPQVAVGIQDIGGTGLFSSEYLVASKQWKDFDFSLGMGWGYMAHGSTLSNPLTHVSDRFRSRGDNSSTGEVSFGNFFSGENAAVFGGIEYRPEGTPFTFQVEYDPNDYANEPRGQAFKQDSHFNFGVVYSVSPSVDLRVGYERGNQWMVGLVFQTNFTHQTQPKVFDPAPVAINANSPRKPKPEAWESIANQLSQNAGWQVRSIKRMPHEVRIEGAPVTYRNQAKGIGRASRILANETSPDVRWFSFVNQNIGGKMSEISIDRGQLTKAIDDDITIPELARSGITVSKPEAQGDEVYKKDPNRFFYDYGPGFQPTVGGPDAFLLYQISAKFTAGYLFGDKTLLSGETQLGLIDNYDKFKYDAPSNLPRVRTYLRQYLTTSKLRMTNLQLTHFDQVENDWFSQVYGGYLEYGYAGVGGELLYRPFGKRWALGGDINYARQRDFDDRFGLRDYDVITGHATAYYRLPWVSNTLAQVSAGRYLAKDIGMTVNVNHQFENGVRVGAWATLTNVSKEDFGEGSFDKGLYITIPFDSFFMHSSPNVVTLPWNFLTRDGGQMLGHRYRLYDMTESRNIDAFYNGINEIVK